jgi:hypothetical protein
MYATQISRIEIGVSIAFVFSRCPGIRILRSRILLDLGCVDPGCLDSRMLRSWTRCLEPGLTPFFPTMFRKERGKKVLPVVRLALIEQNLQRNNLPQNT